MWRMLTSNYIINVGVASWFLAQTIKIILTFITTKQIQWERFVGAGGMPSSHSALTTSIAIAMYRKVGFASPEFALAAMFAIIVMYDAMGVRRAAGEQAKVINKIVTRLTNFSWLTGKPEQADYIEPSIDTIADKEEKKQLDEVSPITNKRLKEFIGHTPLEVLGGIVLGVIVALTIPMG